MVLTRLGNKRKMKDHLHSHFPTHKMRIELFFGAGGSFFYLPPPKYAILNDLDDDVTNLYRVILDHKDKLINEIKIMPVAESLIKHWQRNHETDPVKKAVRFLLLSNFTYLGKGNTLKIGLGNEKANLLNYIEPTFLKLQNAKITNRDFRDVIDNISFNDKIITKDEAFVYLDPIYLNTSHYYKVPKWKESDTEDCFKIMANCGIKAAMSEFNTDKIIELAKTYEMRVIPIKIRNNIKNKRQEILITNYENHQFKMF